MSLLVSFAPTFSIVCALFYAVFSVTRYLCKVAVPNNGRLSPLSMSRDAPSQPVPGKRRLVVLCLNGLLFHRMWKHMEDQDERVVAMIDSASSVGEYWIWDRPERDTFIDYCFKHFDVATWCDGNQNEIDELCSRVFGDRELAFKWGHYHLEIDVSGRDGPTPRKPIASILQAFPVTWAPQDILMIDCSRIKMVPNPPESVLLVPWWTPCETPGRFLHDDDIMHRLRQFRKSGTKCKEFCRPFKKTRQKN